MKMDEKGVSPVIGVILMVAITVILAAIIAGFVFGLGGTVKPVKTPGFSVTRENSTNVTVVLTSMGGALNVSNCTATPGGNLTATNDGWTVGEVVSIGVPEGSRLVIACEVDGVKQVVLDSRV